MRLHLIAAVLVMSLGFWKGLDAVRWMLLVLLIAVVIAAELINTAIEAVVDLASPEQHPLAKAAKDTAAGSVLVLAFAAVVIAAFLFLF